MSGFAGVPVDSWTQRVGAFTALPALVRELGGDPFALSSVAGLVPHALDDPDGRISYQALSQFLNLAAERTGCAHIGLLAGRFWHLRDLGLLGRLALNSATVGDALHALVRHQHLNSEGGAAFLIERGDWTDLGYAVYCPSVSRANQIADAVVAGAFNFMRELCGGGWQPTAVLLAHAAPRDMSPYRALFKLTPRFDAEYSAVRFPARWMETPVAGADVRRRRRLQTQAAAVGDGGVVERVCRALRIGLATGRSSGDDIAKALHINRRTLNRHLEAAGTTFQALLDEVRYATARQLLAGSHLPLDDVAAALGYGGVTQFMRRFRCWSGGSPGDWRRKVQRADASALAAGTA